MTVTYESKRNISAEHSRQGEVELTMTLYYQNADALTRARSTLRGLFDELDRQLALQLKGLGVHPIDEMVQ